MKNFGCRHFFPILVALLSFSIPSWLHATHDRKGAVSIDPNSKQGILAERNAQRDEAVKRSVDSKQAVERVMNQRVRHLVKAWGYEGAILEVSIAHSPALFVPAILNDLRNKSYYRQNPREAREEDLVHDIFLRQTERAAKVILLLRMKDEGYEFPYKFGGWDKTWLKRVFDNASQEMLEDVADTTKIQFHDGGALWGWFSNKFDVEESDGGELTLRIEQTGLSNPKKAYDKINLSEYDESIVNFYQQRVEDSNRVTFALPLGG